MEEKKNEAIKKYNNPFGSILLVATVVGLGYWCFPAIVNSLQMVTLWFTLILRNILVVFVLVNTLIVSIYVSLSKTTEKNKQDLYDQYYAAVPTVIRTMPKYNDYRVTEVKDDECNHLNNKESGCYDDHQEVIEMSSKTSYRRTRTKTASWRSQTIDGLSSEEFRTTVETFITEKKKKALVRQKRHR